MQVGVVVVGVVVVYATLAFLSRCDSLVVSTAARVVSRLIT